MSQTLKKVKDIQGKQELLLVSLNKFYKDPKNREGIKEILVGNGKISLRIIDWFVTNYAKKFNVEYLIKSRVISPKRSSTLKKLSNSKISKKDINKYNSANRQFNVFLNYKSQLRAYSKKQFDPFCRRNRIDFYFTDDDFITTTVGQLNFFRWSMQNNVIDYIIKNYSTIEKDMNENTKKQRQSKKGEEEVSTPTLNNDMNSIKEEVKKEMISNDNINSIGTHLEINLQTINSRKKRHPLSVAATNNMNKNNIPVLVNFD